MTPNQIIIHHTVTPRDQAPDRAELGINNSHKARNWGSTLRPIYAQKSSLGWYVQYQYLIFGSGEVRQYRKVGEVGWHSSDTEANSRGIAVCLTGNFDAEQPSGAQTKALRSLVQTLRRQYGALPIRYHRHYNPHKSCPGRLIPEGWVDSIIKDNDTMKLVKDRGTVFIISGVNEKRKIGLANMEAFALFGDEPIEEMDTSSIQSGSIITRGLVINNS